MVKDILGTFSILGKVHMVLDILGTFVYWGKYT